jgi:hypothetical protein
LTCCIVSSRIADRVPQFRTPGSNDVDQETRSGQLASVLAAATNEPTTAEQKSCSIEAYNRGLTWIGWDSWKHTFVS